MEVLQSTLKEVIPDLKKLQAGAKEEACIQRTYMQSCQQTQSEVMKGVGMEAVADSRCPV